MRELLIGLMFLGACGSGDDGEVAVDAHEDPAAWFQGGWNLTWECSATCRDHPARVDVRTMIVADLSLVFGEVDSDQATLADGCLAIAEAVEGPRTRRAYALCPDGDALTGAVTWTISGGVADDAPWNVHAVR